MSTDNLNHNGSDQPRFIFNVYRQGKTEKIALNANSSLELAAGERAQLLYVPDVLQQLTKDGTDLEIITQDGSTIRIEKFFATAEAESIAAAVQIGSNTYYPADFETIINIDLAGLQYTALNGPLVDTFKLTQDIDEFWEEHSQLILPTDTLSVMSSSGLNLGFFITPPNDNGFIPPAVTHTLRTAPNSYTLQEDSIINGGGNVLTNDVDSDAGHSLAVNKIQGVNFSFSQDISPTSPAVITTAYGTLTVNSDGSYYYNLDNSSSIVQSLNPSNPPIIDTYLYTVTDNAGLTSTSSLSITILGANDPPNLGDDFNSTTEDSPLTVNAANGVLNNDSDIDTGDSLTITGYSATSTLGAVVTLNPDGSYLYDPTVSSTLNSLALGEISIDTFTYTAADSHNASDTATVHITVTGVNDAPVAAADLNAIDEGDTSVTGNILINDIDVDNNATLTVAQVIYNATTQTVGTNFTTNYGTINIGTDGNYTFTLDNANATVQNLNNGQSLTEQVIYTVSDEYNATDVETLTIVINGRNGVDIFSTQNENATILEANGASTNPLVPFNAQTVTGNILLNDNFDFSGPGAPPIINIAYDGSLGAAVANTSTPGQISFSTAQWSLVVITSGTSAGNYTFIQSAHYTHTNTQNVSATGNFTYTLQDGDGATLPGTLALTIVDATPQAVDNAATVEQGASVTGNVLLNDRGVDIPFSAIAQTVSGSYGALTLNGNGTYVYNATPAASGVDTFTYTMQDSDGDQAIATLTITITNNNHIPIANNDAASITEDVSPSLVAGNLLTNDSDIDNNALTITSYGTPTYAESFSVNTASGAYQYTLDNTNPLIQGLAEGAQLLDSVTYNISDGHGGSASATLLITIFGANDNPTAMADNNSVTEAGVNAGVSIAVGTTLSGGLLLNDDDIDGDPLIVFNAGNVLYGDMHVNFDGSYQYTLNNTLAAVNSLSEGELLYDTMTYSVSDGHGGISTSSLVITIVGANDAPVAVNDADHIAEFSPVPLAGNVINNDSDVDHNAALSISSIMYGASTHTVGTHVVTDYGVVTVNADGSYNFTLDGSNSAVQNLNDGDSLVEDIVYTLTDEFGATSIATLSIVIDGQTNITLLAAPDSASLNEANGDGPGTTFIPQTITGNILANDNFSPVGLGNPAITDFQYDGSLGTLVSQFATPAEITFTGDAWRLIIITDGANAGDYTFSQFAPYEHLNTQDVTASGNFVYTAQNIFGSTVQSTLTLSIIDDVPQANNDVNSSDAGETVTGNVLLNDDAGADGGLSVIGGATQVIAGSIGTLTLYTDGSYTYIADPNTEGVDSFVYTAQDADGDTSVATLSITIPNYVNHPPIVVDDANSVTEDIALTATGNLLSNDTDVDTGDSLTIASYGTSTLSSSLNLDTITGNYTYTLNNANSLVQQLAAGETLIDTIAYTVSDRGGLTDNGFLNVTIYGVNDAPTVNSDSNSVTENGFDSSVSSIGVATASGNVLTNDSDIDGGTLTATGISSASYGTVSIDSAGNYEYTLNNNLSIVNSLSLGETLHETLTYNVSDGQGGTNSEVLVITIVGANDAPLAIDDYRTLSESANASLTGNVILDNNGTLGHDSDVDNGALLSVNDLIYNGTIHGVGSSFNTNYGTLIVNADGSYTFNLDYNNTAVQNLNTGQALTENITYTLIDEYNATDVATLSIVIDGLTGIDILSAQDDNASILENAGAANTIQSPFTPQTITGNILANDNFNFSGPGTPPIIDINYDNNLGAAIVDNSTPGEITYTASEWSLVMITSGVNAGDYTFIQTAPYSHTGLQSDTATGSFTYTIEDSLGATIPATLTLNIVDSTPLARNDNASVNQNNTVIGNVTDNDKAADVNLTVIGGATQVLNGTYGALTLYDNGNYVYSAAVAVSGVDTFTYTIQDADGDASTAVLNINVFNNNQPPVAVNDHAVVTEDLVLSVSGNIKTNDSDPDNDTITIIGYDNPNTALQYDTLFTLDTVSGAYTYTLNNSASAVNSLAQDELLTETLGYTISDGHGGTATASLLITIVGSNDAPVALNDTNSITEGALSPVTGNLLANDTDVDNAAILSVSQVSYNNTTQAIGSGFNTNYGSITINVDGTYSFTVDNNNTNVQNLDVGQTLTEQVVYIAKDEYNATSSATLSIVIHGIADANLPIATDESANINEASGNGTGTTFNAQTITGNILSNDTFGLPGQSATPITDVTYDNALGAATKDTSVVGRITFTADNWNLVITTTGASAGAYTFIQTAAYDHTGLQDVVATGAFTYTIQNASTLTDQGVLSISITDDVPIAVDDDNCVEQGLSQSGNVLDNDDAGADNGLAIYGGAAQTLVGSLGTLTLNLDGSYTYTADTGVAGIDTFAYTITDADGDTAVATLSMSVSNDKGVEVLINTLDNLDVNTIANNSAYPTINLAANRTVRATRDGSVAPIYNTALILGSLSADIITGDANANSLNGQDGNDTITGDFKVRSFNSTTASPLTTAVLSLSNSNTLVGDCGNDVMAGNIQTLTLASTSQDSLTSGAGIISTNMSATISFFNGTLSTITGDIGDDTIYGNLNVLNSTNIAGGYYTATGATVTLTTFTTTLVSNQISTNTNRGEVLTFGREFIDGGTENDTIYGDVNTINYSYQGSSNDNASASTNYVSVDGQAMATTVPGGSYSAVSTINNYISNAATLTQSFTYGADTISGGSGNDIIVGDANTLNYDLDSGSTLATALASAYGKLRVWILDRTDLTFSASSRVSEYIKNNVTLTSTTSGGIDSITGGDGNDTIIGDIASAIYTYNTGNQLTTANSDATGYLHDGGRRYTLAAALTSVADNYIENNITQAGTLTSASDALLQGGVGDDYIVGDIGQFTVTAVAGSSLTAGSTTAFGGSASDYIQDRISFTNRFIFGSDSISGGTENDTLIGDVDSLNYDLTGGSNLQSGTVSARQYVRFVSVPANSPPAFSDTYSIQNSTNNGTIPFLNISVVSNSYILSSININNTNFISFGADTSMSGGAGNDILIGDIRSLAFTFNGGSNLTSSGNTLFYRLEDASSSNATVTGMVVTAANYIDASSVIQSSNITFGSDFAMKGDEGNDTLIGDAQVIALTFEAGDNANAGSSNITYATTGTAGGDTLSATLTSQTYIDNSAHMTSCTITFGTETSMQGGAGNDILIGDVQSLALSLYGGLNADAGNIVSSLSPNRAQDVYTLTADASAISSAYINNSRFTFGNDTMYGDDIAGTLTGNDTLYGDAVNFMMTLEGGSGKVDGSANADVRAYISNTTFTFGNDNMSGGLGNDTLIGDFYSMQVSLTNGTTISDTGSGSVLAQASISTTTITLGSDTLNGGSGDDTLTGDVVSYLNYFNALRNAGTNNLVDWGNDTLTGGSGSDNFVFALDRPISSNLMNMQGVDIVTDFALGTDKLVIGNVKDVNGDTLFTAADLDSSAVFINLNNLNALAIIFHDPASGTSPPAIVGDTAITNATSFSNAVTAIDNNSSALGAIILQGHTTATISSFSSLNGLNSLVVSSTDTLV